MTTAPPSFILISSFFGSLDAAPFRVSHADESLGWWRRSAEIKRVHFAEEWNEFHHLLIMEALGGDQKWSDRFAAQHAAVLYYWVLVGLWLFSPSIACES